LCKNIDALTDDVTFESSLFPEIPRQIISMISTILGKDIDLVVDEFMLGNKMSTCPFIVKPLNKFNYAQFLTDQIHHQLSEFETLIRFRYKSYLVHLFLFLQAIHFSHLGMKIEDEIGNPVSVIHWTSLIKKKTLNIGFSEYVDQFMSKAYQIIHDEIPPRVFPECKNLLQPSPENKVGDWYIF
jgi:hypothetical protein